jgi:hypothetical protein
MMWYLMSRSGESYWDGVLFNPDYRAAIVAKQGPINHFWPHLFEGHQLIDPDARLCEVTPEHEAEFIKRDKDYDPEPDHPEAGRDMLLSMARTAMHGLQRFRITDGYSAEEIAVMAMDQAEAMMIEIDRRSTVVEEPLEADLHYVPRQDIPDGWIPPNWRPIEGAAQGIYYWTVERFLPNGTPHGRIAAANFGDGWQDAKGRCVNPKYFFIPTAGEGVPDLEELS